MSVDVNIQATEPNGLNNQTQPPVSAPAAALSGEEIFKEIAALRAENARLQAERSRSFDRKLTLKVSEKGALSAYGLGRFPVTLYKEQWSRLLAEADAIKAFLIAHDKELKTKGD